MKKKYRWKWMLLPATLFVVVPTPGIARENTLTSSIGLTQEYDSNMNLTDTDRLTGWSSIISPGLQLTSLGTTDQLKVSYELGLKRNHATDEDSINHDFLLQGDSKLSSLWKVGVLNRFYLSDDSNYAGTPVPEVDKNLSDRRDRVRFSLNTFSVNSDYQFAPDSTIVMSYENRILDNRSEGENLDDYTRHNPNLLLGYQLNRQWRSEVGYSYIRGEFDQADDLETHIGKLRMIYQATPINQLFAGYNINQTTYQGPTEEYRIHNIFGGWKRNLGPQTIFTVTAGQAILDRQHNSTLNIFSYSADLQRKLQRGSIFISGKGGIDEMQFSGDANEGLSRYHELGLGGNYQLMEKLLADLALSWRENDFIDNSSVGRERIYQANCGLSYGLTSWCQISTRYFFTELKELETEATNGDYQDHRMMLELKGSYDVFKW